jgi:hypothetical protein
MFNIDVITKDPDIAKKLLIGSLLVLSGIGIFALLGWMMEIVREVQRGEEPALPPFDDIGTLFIDGLKLSAIGVVWSLPVALIVVVVVVLGIGSTSFFNNSDDAAMALIILNFCVVGLVFIYMIPLFALFAPATGLLAETGDLKQALDPRKALAIFRTNPGGFLLAMLLGAAVNSLMGSIGAILCLIGIYPAMVVSYALQGQFFGKAYRDAKNLGETI